MLGRPRFPPQQYRYSTQLMKPQQALAHACPSVCAPPCLWHRPSFSTNETTPVCPASERALPSFASHRSLTCGCHKLPCPVPQFGCIPPSLLQVLFALPRSPVNRLHRSSHTHPLAPFLHRPLFVALRPALPPSLQFCTALAPVCLYVLWSRGLSAPARSLQLTIQVACVSSNRFSCSPSHAQSAPTAAPAACSRHPFIEPCCPPVEQCAAAVRPMMYIRLCRVTVGRAAQTHGVLRFAELPRAAPAACAAPL